MVARQEAPAGGDLGADRLVLGRHAAHRIGDRRADERQAVVGPRLEDSFGEAERDQRPVEQVAGKVAGERPAGSVGAAQAGRQPDDQQPDTVGAFRRHEGRHRRIEPAGFPDAPFGDEIMQPRAQRTVMRRLGAVRHLDRRHQQIVVGFGAARAGGPAVRTGRGRPRREAC